MEDSKIGIEIDFDVAWPKATRFNISAYYSGLNMIKDDISI